MPVLLLPLLLLPPQCVPALASEYLYAFQEAGPRLSCLTRFLTGGEALTPKLAQEVVATLPGLSKPGGGLFNSYGPTEVTVTVRGGAGRMGEKHL